MRLSNESSSFFYVQYYVTGKNAKNILKFNEDDKIVLSAINSQKKRGINVSGPFPADTIFLKKNRDVTALICCTEYIAAGAIKACYELDFKIGKNFSLITYDSLIISHLTQPSLTSASHPVNELGSQAIEILLQKRVNNKNNSYLAVPEIINRGSVHLVEN